MPNLNWVRVDANVGSNHKILSLLDTRGGDRAINVWIFGLGYCGQHGTDGFIPRAALGLIHGSAKVATMLVDVGLWQEIPGGYQVHGYAEFQPLDADAQMRSDRARKAAEKRWGTAQ